MLPLIGRIADLRGRVPVLVGSLVVFSIGSLVTAASYDLASMVVGRFLQGVGGGGLVPATLALVADIWTAERRGLPLGVVGAVQELGSVLGPLYGALVLAVSTWHTIFWINLAVGLVLAAALVVARHGSSAEVHDSAAETGTSGPRPAGHPDWLGGLLAAGAVARARPSCWSSPSGSPAASRPGARSSPTSATPAGRRRWRWPSYVLAAAVRRPRARRPGVRWSSCAASASVARSADLPGAALLGLGAGRHRAGLRDGRPRGAGLLARRSVASWPAARSPPGCSSGDSASRRRR